jgi:hypothetical protein
VWQREHSWPHVDVNVPEDLEFCEFVFSEEFSRSRYEKEAKESGVSIERLVNAKFEEWKCRQCTLKAN